MDTTSMYLALPQGWVEPTTHTVLDAGVLEVLDFVDQLANPQRDEIRFAIFPTVSAMQAGASPLSEMTIMVTSAELAAYQPVLLRGMLSLLAARPAFAGSNVVTPSGGAPSSAQVALGPAAKVNTDETAVLPQKSATVNGTGLSFDSGKLTVVRAGQYLLTAHFELNSGSGNGQLLASGVVIASQPTNGALADPVYSGYLAAGRVIDVAFHNSGTSNRAVADGGVLNAG